MMSMFYDSAAIEKREKRQDLFVEHLTKILRITEQIGCRYEFNQMKQVATQIIPLFTPTNISHHFIYTNKY